MTGASGFIGRYVVEAAARRGYEVMALARDSYKSWARRHQIVAVNGDVRDPESIRSALRGCRSAST